MEGTPVRTTFGSSLLSRRCFTHSGTLAAGAASLNLVGSLRGADAPSNRLVVGIMGLGRGKGHIAAWLGVPGVEIAYLCDVDVRREEEAARMVKRAGQQKAAKFVNDFRIMLHDPELDIVSIAAPNHWHAPAAILSCKAGKHVYVEKPGSHNPREGELIVEAARKYNRKVQMGVQRRSYPAIREGIQKLHEGVIGKVVFGRSHFLSQRAGIGVGSSAPVPVTLDYNLWQGAAPAYPYKDNLLPYNWQWIWHFGGGELANNGIHGLDILRWGLRTRIPKKVTFLGGRYHFRDDQETPDTGVAQFDFGGCGAVWEQSSCHRQLPEKLPFVSFAGEGGLMEVSSAGYTIYDLQGKEVETNPGTASDVPHFQNLADSIRNGVALNSEIAEGQASALLCHLGNIAYRTGRVLVPEAGTGKPSAEPEAMKLWAREYRNGWEPAV